MKWLKERNINIKILEKWRIVAQIDDTITSLEQAKEKQEQVAIK